jgi:ribose transport system permease protein
MSYLADLRRRPTSLAVVLAAALLVVNIVVRPSFATPSSVPSLLAVFAPFALVAMASVPSIVSGGGGIDVSVGPLATIVNVVIVAWLLPRGIDEIWLVIPCAVVFGAFVGAVNGFLSAVMRYQPVIATLCAYFVLTGLALQILPRPVSGTTAWLDSAAGSIGPVPGALLFILAPLALWALLRTLPFTDLLYAVGGNDAAAFSAGVNVPAVRICAYAVGGAVAGLAGVSLTALLQSADATIGAQYTLAAIAAVALGGISLSGGSGGLFGALAGAACIFLIQTMLDSLGVASAWAQVAYGVLLVVAILLQSSASASTRGAVT